MFPEKPEGVEYTYGERLFSHHYGKNQIEYIINKLSKIPYSRRAIGITWNHVIDPQVQILRVLFLFKELLQIIIIIILY
jgi:thymidylate synthase